MNPCFSLQFRCRAADASFQNVLMRDDRQP